jgi:hypothetical protein
MTEQEAANFEARGIHGADRGKSSTRVSLIPPS